MTVTLTGEQLDIHKRIMSIFYPHAMRRREHVIKNKIRFVHYTTAANALSIIRTKRMWMRNTTCMTDYREVQHGLDALNRYLAVAENKAAFDAALNECFPGSADETIGLFNSWWQTTQLNTYIASISEHDDREDLHGHAFQCGAPSAEQRHVWHWFLNCHWSWVQTWRFTRVYCR